MYRFPEVHACLVFNSGGGDELEGAESGVSIILGVQTPNGFAAFDEQDQLLGFYTQDISGAAAGACGVFFTSACLYVL